MTRNEAIDRVREHMAIHKLNEPRAVKVTEALNMAIEALENQTDDSQKIVRCRDCRFGLRGSANVVCMRNSFHFAHDPDWFCADGRTPEEKGTAE